MKEINVGNGIVSLVDDDDFEKFGKVKWHVSSDGYVKRTFYVKEIKKFDQEILSRLIMNASKGEEVHHIDLNPLNNQKSNLKCLTRPEHLALHNRINESKKGPKSGRFKGVSFVKNINNYKSQIKINGKSIHLGCFDKEEDAARSYDRAVIKYKNGENYLNFPSEIIQRIIELNFPEIRKIKSTC